MEGDCYLLASKYLSMRDRAFIISDGIRGKFCTWNFKGNTDADFAAWCKREGLSCGGNPFYVGYDSVWFKGEFMPHERAIYLRSVDDSLQRERKRIDSLSANVPADSSADPLPIKNVVIEYLEMGKGTADKLGFSYSELIGSAKMWDYTDLFSVSIQAQKTGDTSFVYRNYTTNYDSLLHVFWGGSRDKMTQSNITSNGVVSNNYESESYGLTFDIENMKYTYTHSNDFEHSISGSGLLEWGENLVIGNYQYTYSREDGLPFLSALPLFGFLFRHTYDVTEQRFVFIRVVVGLPDDV